MIHFLFFIIVFKQKLLLLIINNHVDLRRVIILFKKLILITDSLYHFGIKLSTSYRSFSRLDFVIFQHTLASLSSNILISRTCTRLRVRNPGQYANILNSK